MKNLIIHGADYDKTANVKTFSSVELTEQINIFRNIEGNRAELLHKTFIATIEDEFEEEIGEQNILPTSYTDKSNRQSKCYELTFEQSLQILMRESKFVRKGVTKEYLQLKNQQPKQNYESALKMLGMSDELIPIVAKTYYERDEAIRTKAYISDKKTATALGKVGGLTKSNNQLKIELNKSLEYATIKKVEIVTKQKYQWQKLRNYCNANELEMKSVPDVNYGTVRSYPKQAWLDVYGIDISNL